MLGGKEENTGHQHFLLFSTMMSTLPKTSFNFFVKFILSSENAFNLDKTKILSFGKELTLSQMTILDPSKLKEFADDDFELDESSPDR